MVSLRDVPAGPSTRTRLSGASLLRMTSGEGSWHKPLVVIVMSGYSFYLDKLP